MRLILVRHAQTDSNRDRLALGRADPPLNETGRAQSAALAEALAAEPLDAICSSPLRRARATAEAIAGRHPALHVREEPDLIEMDVGETDGLGFAEIRELYPDFMRDWLSERVASVAMPGGESLQGVQDRAWRAVQRMIAECPDGSVLAVSHNFVILALLCRAMDMDLSSFRRLRQDVAAYSIVDLRESRTVVVRLNETCHLEGGRLPAPGAFPRPSSTAR